MIDSKRLEWLDSMRGVTMIFVVMYHVMIMSFTRPTQGILTFEIIELMFMPLFFLISGFLAYKNDLFCNQSFWQLVLKKAKIQIPSTIIFFTLYVIICFPNIKDTFVNFIERADKGGYWFTIVLFYMFLIYYSISYINKLLKNIIGRGELIFLMWFISIILYTSLCLPSWITYDYIFLNFTSFGRLLQYLHCFFAGMLIRRYWNNFEKVIGLKWFYPSIILVTIICTVELFVLNILPIQIRNIIRLLSIYLLVVIVITIFRHYQNIFSQKTFVGRILSYMGRYTLDIYLIHFILLPLLPVATGQLIENYGGGIIIEGTLYFTISMFIIGGCLLISHILRVSPALGKFLFGK